MFEAPMITFWVDIFLISLLFAVLSKLVQHFTSNPKEYFYIKIKTKELNKEMKELSKTQNFEKIKEKQKEAFSFVGKQFKLQRKSMLVMLLIAFPMLWFINKYYLSHIYNFILFKVSGFWAYVILGVLFSLILNNIYDKIFIKKYFPTGKVD